MESLQKSHLKVDIPSPRIFSLHANWISCLRSIDGELKINSSIDKSQKTKRFKVSQWKFPFALRFPHGIVKMIPTWCDLNGEAIFLLITRHWKRNLHNLLEIYEWSSTRCPCRYVCEWSFLSRKISDWNCIWCYALVSKSTSHCQWFIIGDNSSTSRFDTSQQIEARHCATDGLPRPVSIRCGIVRPEWDLSQANLLTCFMEGKKGEWKSIYRARQRKGIDGT